MTLATLIALATGETEHSGNTALETIVFPIIALSVFGLLALVTVSYRNVANRHVNKADAYARTHETDVERAGHGH